MPCPHNQISIVQRSNRQSAVAAAAYQSGEKLFCEYDQQVKHYPETVSYTHLDVYKRQDYILVGDYYIPDLKLPEEHRPIGKYGRMHREHLREVHPARLNTLILTGELWTYLADLNEQAQKRFDTIMEPVSYTHLTEMDGQSMSISKEKRCLT